MEIGPIAGLLISFIFETQEYALARNREEERRGEGLPPQTVTGFRGARDRPVGDHPAAQPHETASPAPIPAPEKAKAICALSPSLPFWHRRPSLMVFSPPRVIAARTRKERFGKLGVKSGVCTPFRSGRVGLSPNRGGNGQVGGASDVRLPGLARGVPEGNES